MGEEILESWCILYSWLETTLIYVLYIYVDGDWELKRRVGSSAWERLIPSFKRCFGFAKIVDFVV